MCSKICYNNSLWRIRKLTWQTMAKCLSRKVATHGQVTRAIQQKLRAFTVKAIERDKSAQADL